MNVPGSVFGTPGSEDMIPVGEMGAPTGVGSA